MLGGNIIKSREERWLEQEPENSLNHKCEVESELEKHEALELKAHPQ